MDSKLNSRFLDDPEFQSLLVGCLESLQRGDEIDRDALAKDFPRFAVEIERFLNDRELLEAAASGFGDVPPSRIAISAYANTMDSNSKQSDFTIGESIRYIGEYEVLEEIARGGMGVVFKARQQKLNRIVALKMILAGKLADESDIERFYREARAAGKLQHTNIVPVHEIGEFEGRHYFTMDFVDGPSLADTIRDETLAPRVAARIVQETANAVHFAHHQETVHRDLKPANILLANDGHPMVTDFGLAKMLGNVSDETRAELTASGQILGTPSYMSPEQAAGNQESVGPASDIYSLGAILYACLTGRAPFVANSPVDTLIQVINKDPVSPRDLNPSVPKDLETICLKCLTKEPHKRYATAQDLADDLGRYLEGRPVLARPVGTLSKAIRWCHRNPTMASLLGLVFLSMAIGTTVSIYYAKSAKDLAESESVQRRFAENARAHAQTQRDAAQEARQLAEQRGDDLKRQLYIAQMPRALEDWNTGNIARVREILQQHVPDDGEEDLRGFEWYYLQGLTESSRLTIETGQTISGVNISPDGQKIATVAQGSLLLHSLDDGTTIAEFGASWIGDIAGVAFDSTSQNVCVSSQRVRLWNLTEKRLVWEQDSLLGCKWCAFTPDDLRIVSTHNEWNLQSARVQIRAVDSGKLLSEFQLPHVISSATLDASGQFLFCACGDAMLRKLDLDSGKLLTEWPCCSAAFTIKCHPDGRSLLVANGDGLLEFHDSLAGKRVQRWGPYLNSFKDVAFDWSGAQFVGVGDSQRIHFFDATNGQPIRELRGHATVIDDVEFRADYKEVVTTDREGVIHVWNHSGQQGLVETENASGTAAIADALFTPDGRWLVSCEGTQWAKNDKGIIRLLDLDTFKPGPILDGHEQGIFGLAVDDRMIYSAGNDGHLMAWDLASLEMAWSRSFDQPLGSLAVATDGQCFVVGDRKGQFYVLTNPQAEAAAQFQVPGNHDRYQSIAISPNARFVAGASRLHMRVVDWKNDVVVLDQRHKLIRSMAFDPTGRMLAVAGDGIVTLYDTETWRLLREIKADSQPIAGISFHPNSPQLVTRSINGSLKFWETNSWQNVLSLALGKDSTHDHHDPVFSPDGRMVIGNRHADQLRLITTEGSFQQPEPIDSATLVQQAHHAVNFQKWSEAFESFEKAIAAGDERVWSHVHATEVATMLDQTDQTKSRIHASVRLAEQLLDEHPTVAARLIQAAQLIPNTDPTPEKSLQIVQQVWQQEGGDSAFPLAFTLFRQGKDAELVEFRELNQDFLKASATFPLLHAASLYRLGRIAEANSIFDQAADRYASQMPPVGRGRVLSRNSFSGFVWDLHAFKEVSEIALEALNQAIDKQNEITDQNDEAELHAARGLLHRRWHCWKSAFDDLTTAATLEPENVDYLSAATTSAVLAGEFRAADEMAKMLIQQSQGEDTIWSAGRIVYQIPNATCLSDELLQAVDESAKARPTQGWRKLAVIGLLYRLGHLDQALSELEAFEQGNPRLKGLGTALLRGLILVEKGDDEEAAKALAIAESMRFRESGSPGIFPSRGQHAFVDEIVLYKELVAKIDEAATGVGRSQ